MFSTYETSRFGGRPYHLFIFRRQAVSLRFASTGPGRNVTVGGHTYLGAQIERGEIRQTVERAKDRVKITFPYVLDLAGLTVRGEPAPVTQALGDWWRPYIPSDPIYVTCLAGHHGDTDPPIVEWMGWAVQPEFGDLELTLTCDSNVPAGESRGQGMRWQKSCGKACYSTGIRGCNLPRPAFRVSGTLSAVDGLTLTSAAFAGSEFPLQGGTLYWMREDGIEEERPIMAHTGSTVQILFGGRELEAGIAFSAEPNCPGTWAACEARENTLNYGGSLFKPIKDPTSGTSMSWG